MHHSVTLVLQKPGTVGTKPSALENLEMPHPGMSYNPVFEDHQVRPGVGKCWGQYADVIMGSRTW